MSVTRQKPIATILKVDLYGTAMLLEEFSEVIAYGGSAIVISSQSGCRMPFVKRAARHFNKCSLKLGCIWRYWPEKAP